MLALFKMKILFRPLLTSFQTLSFKRANVIIITLFITLVVGLMGLLITKYIYNLVKVSAENHKYYKAYYIGYAGVELELLKLKNHWLGFEDKVSVNSDTVVKNFSGLNYHFSGQILSLTKNVTANPLSLLFNNVNCSDKKNWISLNTWDAILLPLFYDKNIWEAKLSGQNYELLNVVFSNVTLNYDWRFVVALQSKLQDRNVKSQVSWVGDKLLSDIFSVTSFGGNVEDEPYLIVWALEKWSFCIHSDDKLVDIYSYVQSWGSYKDRKVLLNVAKKNKWANFTVYGIY